MHTKLHMGSIFNDDRTAISHSGPDKVFGTHK